MLSESSPRDELNVFHAKLYIWYAEKCWENNKILEQHFFYGIHDEKVIRMKKYGNIFILQFPWTIKKWVEKLLRIRFFVWLEFWNELNSCWKKKKNKFLAKFDLVHRWNDSMKNFHFRILKCVENSIFFLFRSKNHSSKMK